MKSKKPQNSSPSSSSSTIRLRALGQLSIHSTRLLRTPTTSDGHDHGSTGRPSSRSTISLADYLNRKLRRTPVHPATAPRSIPSSTANTLLQGNHNPFFSSVGHYGDSVFTGIGNECKGSRLPEVTATNVIEDSLFKQFNYIYTRQENERNVELSGGNEIRVCVEDVDVLHESKKRKNPSGGGLNGDHDLHSPRKHLVILGDDPTPKHTNHEENSASKKKPKPLYNYYENGIGWWDSEREGIDSDEVGCNEVWEGMGSTTLGGLEWH
ncbi:hypothetical protein Ancab_031304 [Ancistrocladus abbreviatus]